MAWLFIILGIGFLLLAGFLYLKWFVFQAVDD